MYRYTNKFTIYPEENYLWVYVSKFLKMQQNWHVITKSKSNQSQFFSFLNNQVDTSWNSLDITLLKIVKLGFISFKCQLGVRHLGNYFCSLLQQYFIKVLYLDDSRQDIYQLPNSKSLKINTKLIFRWS